MIEIANDASQAVAPAHMTSAVQNPILEEGVFAMRSIVLPHVFGSEVRVGSHRDRLGNKQAVSVGVTESGGIEVTLPGAENPTLRLSFDEAEELAAVLGDSALIVRFSHAAGFTEVA